MVHRERTTDGHHRERTTDGPQRTDNGRSTENGQRMVHTENGQRGCTERTDTGWFTENGQRTVHTENGQRGCTENGRSTENGLQTFYKRTLAKTLHTGADAGGGRWGARPPLGRSFTIQNALFNSIQAPVHHWAPTPGRNPVSAPVIPVNETLVNVHR